LFDAGGRGEAAGVLPAAGGATVGERELAGAAAVLLLSLSLSGLRARAVSAARGQEAERAVRARDCGPRLHGPAQFIRDNFVFIIFITDFCSGLKNVDLGFY
jgi:hypothetical protein